MPAPEIPAARDIAIDAASAPVRPALLAFPEPMGSRLAGRRRHPLGDVFGLTNFGVNLTRLAPGASSSPRHAHSHQDEFVYILEGAPTLITDAGETPLAPGMCAGFRSGSGDAHQLVNRSDAEVVFLEIGDRSPGDVVSFADDYAIARDAAGKPAVVRKDGSPY